MATPVLGGIGAGLMQGVQFINQRKQMDDNAAFRQQQMDNQRQQLQMQQEAFDIKKDEVKRIDALGKLKNEIVQQYPDATDPYHQSQLLIQKGVERDLFRGEELDNAYTARTKLRTEFGTQAYDAALTGDIKPLQTLLGERGMAVDYTPDRSALNIWSANGPKDEKGNPVPKQISMEGLMQLDAMGAVRERELARQKQTMEQQKFRAEFGKTQAETDRLRADAELKRAAAAGRAGGMATGQGGGGGQGGVPASGRGGVGSSPTYAVMGFKNQGEMQDFVLKGIGDEGLSFTAADGSSSSIPKEEAVLGIQQNLDLLLDSNPSLPPVMARNIAQSMVLASKGANMEGAQYVPVPALNTQTGQWETVVRSADKVVAKFPTAIVEPTPAQKFEQEGVFARQLVDSGEAQKYATLLKDKPEYVAKIVRALNGNEQEAAAIEAASPGFLRKFQVLYAHTGLGGLVVPDHRLTSERAAIQAERTKLLQSGASAGGEAEKVDAAFSPEEVERSRAAGGRDTPAVGAGEIIGKGVGAVGEGLGLIGDAAVGAVDQRAFSFGLDAARKTGFGVKSVVTSLADLLEKNPELASQMSSDEVWALSVAANRRLSDAVHQNAKKSK